MLSTHPDDADFERLRAELPRGLQQLLARAAASATPAALPRRQLPFKLA